MKLGLAIAEILVLCASFLFFCLGVLIAAFGIKVATVLSEDFEDLDTRRFIIPTIIFGFGLVIFSLLGCVGTIKENKTFLAIYSTGVFAIAVAILAIGGVLFEYNDDVSDSKDGSADNSRQALLLDFAYASMFACCSPIGLQPCSEVIIQNFCQNDPDRVASLQAGMEESGFCDVLEDIEVDGVPLVSSVGVDIISGSCGFNIPAVYVQNFMTVLDDNMSKIAAGDIVVGVFIIVLLAASCFVMATDKKTSSKYRK